MARPDQRAPHPEQPLDSGVMFGPWSATSNYGIGEDKELSGASDKGDLVRLTSGGQARVKRNQARIPLEGGGKGCGEEASAQPLASAGDMAQALMLSTIVIIGSKTGQRRRLFAREASELGHADKQCQSRTRSDAGNALDESKTIGQIIMAAKRSDEPFQLGRAPGFEAFDLRCKDLAMPAIAEAFEPGLGPGDVFFDLLDQRQMFAKGLEARIGSLSNGGGSCRAVSNQIGIDPVVLGPLKTESGIGPDLKRLEENDGKSLLPQISHHTALIPATGFDPDAIDVVPFQPCRELAPTVRCIVDLKPGFTSGQRHIELGFAGIDAGGIDVILTHLRRPFLAMRTLGSVNHPGPMKSRPRSRSGAAHHAKEHTIRRPAIRLGPSSEPG